MRIIDYVPPSVDGKPTDYNQIVTSLEHVKREIEEASAKRDKSKKDK